MNKYILAITLALLASITGCSAGTKAHKKQRIKLPQEHTITIVNHKTYLDDLREAVLDFNHACQKGSDRAWQTNCNFDIYGGCFIHKFAGDNFVIMTVTPDHQECVIVVYWEDESFNYGAFRDYLMTCCLIAFEEDSCAIIEES